MRRFVVSSLALVALGAQDSSAFLPNLLRRAVPYNQPILHATLDQSSSTAGGAMPDDVNLKAYADWRKQYGKGDFNAERYGHFKSNYMTLMGANASAVTNARAQGRSEPELMQLNEYGDCSIEEYKAILSGLKPPQPQESKAETKLDDSKESKMIDTSGGFQMFQSAEALQVAFDEFEEMSDEDRIRSAYSEWCRYNGKDFDESRLSAFSSHFQRVEQFSKETGKPVKLNKYADLTTDEYKLMKAGTASENEKPKTVNTAASVASVPARPRPSPTPTVAEIPKATDPVSDRVRETYGEWCKYYGKQFEESRLAPFSSNMLQMEQYFKKSGQAIQLNKYADLTKEEYQLLNSGGLKTEKEARRKAKEETGVKAELTDSADARVRQAYGGWCEYYGKQFEESRLASFSSNFIRVEQHSKETGQPMKLNEYADLTSEEYKLLNSGASSGVAPGSSSESRIHEERSKAEEGTKLKAEVEARLKSGEEARLKAETEANRAAEESSRVKAEEETRLKAEAEAMRVAEEQTRLNAESEARRNAEEEDRRVAEEQSRLKVEEETRLKAEENALLKIEEESRLKAETKAKLVAEKQSNLNTEAEAEARLIAEKQSGLKVEAEDRLKAYVEARHVAEEQARSKAEAEARRRAEAEARRKAEEEDRLKAEAKRVAEEQARLKAEADAARLKVEAEARQRAQEESRLKAKDEVSKEGESKKKEKAGSSPRPSGSYLGAVAKTWVSRSAYLESLKEGASESEQQTASGGLESSDASAVESAKARPLVSPDLAPFFTYAANGTALVETASSEAMSSPEQKPLVDAPSLLDSLSTLITGPVKPKSKEGGAKGGSMDENTVRGKDNVLNFSQQADELSEDAKKIADKGKEYDELGLARKRQSGDEKAAAARARADAQEWEKIQMGLVNEAEQARQRCEEANILAEEARRKARQLDKSRKSEEESAEGGVFSFISNAFGGGEGKSGDLQPKQADVPDPKRKETSWVTALFDFFGGSEDDEALGRGTILIDQLDEKRKKKSQTFDLFVSPESVAPEELGRSSIRIPAKEETSIFSFFASKKRQESEADKISAYENKRRSRLEKNAKLDSDRARILEDRVTYLSEERKRSEAARAQVRRLIREEASEQQKLAREGRRRLRLKEKEAALASAVPTLSMWSQNKDGAVTGFISNSKDFRTGTQITTSPVTNNAEENAVVVTVSGSQYRLGLPAASDTKNVEDEKPKRKSLFSLLEKVAPEKLLDQLKQDKNGSIAGNVNGKISMLFGGNVKKTNEEAPGVAMLSQWKQNPDGGITGIVRNKDGFKDGTLVTTSPVELGVKSGMVVRTEAGSLYELR